jgi:hypothetical protein
MGGTECTGWDIVRTAGDRGVSVEDSGGAGGDGRGAGLTVAMDREGGIDGFDVIVNFGGRGRALQSFCTWT